MCVITAEVSALIPQLTQPHSVINDESSVGDIVSAVTQGPRSLRHIAVARPAVESVSYGLSLSWRERAVYVRGIRGIQNADTAKITGMTGSSG